jgi:hypothetical protein
MTADVQASFLTYYIRSLAERTRSEKKGDKFGFDWIIYNLAVAQGLIPLRLPFFRGGPTELSPTKTENEFGIDFSFVTADREEMQIFVLKDEVLNSTNWTGNSFDKDLRKAAYPDMSSTELKAVKRVKVILAYNKDEDAAGITLFNNFVAGQSPILGADREISFERWNLTTLVEKAQQHLLTPTLLPQKFFNLFTYICAQFGHFRHGSDQWETILVPMWRQFLSDLLTDQADERSVRLLPVALLILRAHGKNNPSFETGWIDLAEWAVLALWKVKEKTDNQEVQAAVVQMWLQFYLIELGRFYDKYESVILTEHCFDDLATFSHLQSVAASSLAFWHLGRLGLLNVAYGELLPNDTPEHRALVAEATKQMTNRIVGMLNVNPACNRPFLDLHHIEIFLIWRSLFQQRRYNDIYNWLSALERDLYIRRIGHSPLPFIEGYSSMKLVWEHILRKEKPYDFCDRSSFLVLMLLEFCCGLPKAQSDELLQRFYHEIVLGLDSFGKKGKETRPLDLMGWSPPEPWLEKLLTQTLRVEGVSLNYSLPDRDRAPSAVKIRESLEAFVAQTRIKQPFTYPGVPVSLVALACIKHQSPLPMELWRSTIFPEPEQKEPVAAAPEKSPA